MRSLLALCSVFMLSPTLALHAENPALVAPLETTNFNAGWTIRQGDPSDLGNAVSYGKLKSFLLQRFHPQPRPHAGQPRALRVLANAPGLALAELTLESVTAPATR